MKNMPDQDVKKRILVDVESLIDQNRVIAFSDAVFAFAATLLVLKIDLPTVLKAQLTTAAFPTLFASLWPQYLANMITFLVIGYYWLSHHAIFGLVKKFDSTIVWLNLVFLIFLSFLPFPVDLYGDFQNVPMVVVFYCLSLAVVGFLLAGLWWYASKNHRLISSEMSQREIDYYMARFAVAPFVFALSVPLVYVHPIVAQLSWILVIVGSVAVNGIFKEKKLSEIEKVAV